MCSSSRYGKQLGDHHFHLCSDNRDHLKTSSIAPSIAVPLIRPSAFGTELAGPTVSQPSSVSHSSTIIEISSSTIIEISGSSSSTRIRGMEVNRPAGPMRLAGCEVVQDTPTELNERSHVSFPGKDHLASQCCTFSAGRFGSTYSAISTVPTFTKTLSAMSFGISCFCGGSGWSLSVRFNGTPKLQE